MSWRRSAIRSAAKDEAIVDMARHDPTCAGRLAHANPNVRLCTTVARARRHGRAGARRQVVCRIAGGEGLELPDRKLDFGQTYAPHFAPVLDFDNAVDDHAVAREREGAVIDVTCELGAQIAAVSAVMRPLLLDDAGVMRLPALLAGRHRHFV